MLQRAIVSRAIHLSQSGKVRKLLVSFCRPHAVFRNSFPCFSKDPMERSLILSTTTKSKFPDRSYHFSLFCILRIGCPIPISKSETHLFRLVLMQAFLSRLDIRFSILKVAIFHIVLNFYPRLSCVSCINESELQHVAAMRLRTLRHSVVFQFLLHSDWCEGWGK